MNVFHAVNIAIKQQYYNTVQPQLSSDRFTQHMTSQKWLLKRLFLNYANLSQIEGTYFLLPMSFKESFDISRSKAMAYVNSSKTYTLWHLFLFVRFRAVSSTGPRLQIM